MAGDKTAFCVPAVCQQLVELAGRLGMLLAPGYLKRSEEKAACAPFGKHLRGPTDDGENWKYPECPRKKISKRGMY